MTTRGLPSIPLIEKYWPEQGPVPPGTTHSEGFEQALTAALAELDVPDNPDREYHVRFLLKLAPGGSATVLQYGVSVAEKDW